jgi:hypothetical protein
LLINLLGKNVNVINWNFWFNLCFKNVALNKIFIVPIIIFNTIVLNIIIGTIKILPKILFTLNYLKGIIFILIILYYIDLEVLLLT